MDVIYRKEDKLLRINITEEIDHHSVEKIRQKIDYEIELHMPKEVIFDFKGVNFMDSAGIGMIIGRYKIISMLNGKIKLINVNRFVKKIFEMSGILKIIPIIEEEGANTYEKCV
ncbi:MAG: STAS domain-containing protein [Clostridiales bacterium]|nr:STAS domain-containing protein [Clostridiales bacterium]